MHKTIKLDGISRFFMHASNSENHCISCMFSNIPAKVVEEEFGPKFQAAGGKIVFGDNDKNIHSDV